MSQCNDVSIMSQWSYFLRSATPGAYEAFSHDNITNAEKQRVSSCRQRELNEHTMHQTSNDLHKQAETVNESFRIRIQEMITAKTNLEENLNQVICYFDCFSNYRALSCKKLLKHLHVRRPIFIVFKFYHPFVLLLRRITNYYYLFTIEIIHVWFHKDSFCPYS